MKFSEAWLSVTFATCHFASTNQEFLGTIVDGMEIKPAPSKVKAIANMSVLSNAEQLRSFGGGTGYLHNFVKDYRITAAQPTDLLRNKAF